MKEKEIQLLEFSQNDKRGQEAQIIINSLTDLANVRASQDNASVGIFSDSYTMDRKEYVQKNNDVKTSLLGFCAEASGMSGIVDVTTREGLMSCFSMNPQFTAIYNNIIVKAISNVMLNSNPAVIQNFCNIETVDVGDSFSTVIEPKGLPVAQRGSYNSNVTLLDAYTAHSVNIKPQVYTLGVQIDYLRILDGTFDFGKEIARVALAMLWAQYRLVVSLLFTTATISGTPFYVANYTKENMVQLIEILQAVNGGSVVKAYGSMTAFNHASIIDTTGIGFTTQDQLIRDGYLSHANGIDNIALPQATDASVEFTTANLSELLLLPSNYIVLLSAVGSKPITLVREKFVKALTIAPLDGTLYRQGYAYSMSFDAQIATMASWGIVKVA